MTMLDDLTAVTAMRYTRAVPVELASGPRREISLVAVPYDEPAQIVDPDGRRYVESFARDAFKGVVQRISGRSRVTVNRDHDATRVVGKVVKLHPERREGLGAVLRMTRGLQLADDTLALAADDVLSASIAFSPMADGVQWSGDGAEKRIIRAYLHHIALVDEPAYPGTHVESVRSAEHPAVTGEAPPTLTPWLDQMRAQRAAAHYSRLLTP